MNPSPNKNIPVEGRTITNYLICPECGKNTVVAHTGPKEPINFKLYPKDEYWDYKNASLYCCNAETNCKFYVKVSDLITPQK